jgi:hypothetical protein
MAPAAASLHFWRETTSRLARVHSDAACTVLLSVAKIHAIAVRKEINEKYTPLPVLVPFREPLESAMAATIALLNT